MQLQGKRIIVTGGASGIAAETVRAFAREGATVVSVDVDDTHGAAVAEEAAGAGPGQVAYRHCDISRRDEVAAVFEEEISRLGGLARWPTSRASNSRCRPRRSARATSI